MTNFEFVFSLLVILLGLGLGQVLAGLASAVKRRPQLKMGWGTGLLATWVMTETVIFWEIVWRTRNDMPSGAPALFAGFGITALYYFAGALVFPDDLAERGTLDDYFMREKAKVIGAILLAVALSFALRPLVLGSSSWTLLNPLGWASMAFVYLLGAAVMLTSRRAIAVGCLAVMVVIDLLEPVGWLLAAA